MRRGWGGRSSIIGDVPRSNSFANATEIVGGIWKRTGIVRRTRPLTTKRSFCCHSHHAFDPATADHPSFEIRRNIPSTTNASSRRIETALSNFCSPVTWRHTSDCFARSANHQIAVPLIRRLEGPDWIKPGPRAPMPPEKLWCFPGINRQPCALF